MPDSSPIAGLILTDAVGSAESQIRSTVQTYLILDQLVFGYRDLHQRQVKELAALHRGDRPPGQASRAPSAAARLMPACRTACEQDSARNDCLRGGVFES